MSHVTISNVSEPNLVGTVGAANFAESVGGDGLSMFDLTNVINDNDGNMTLGPLRIPFCFE
jgi:hypothetical protein